MMQLAIDPGHGGSDLGTQAGAPGLIEAPYVLARSHELHIAVLQLGWPVTCSLTRVSDETVSLGQRGRRSADAKADLCVHIHVDSNADQSMHGLRTYVWPDNERAFKVAAAIGLSAPARLADHPRPIVATDSQMTEDDWLRRARAVMAPHSCDCVLIELGVASNSGDLAALQNMDIQRQITACLLAGIARAIELYR
jgi:N-acetylmuramoyl-L-alanine amidase